MTVEKKAVIGYRLERAHETLEEARILAENNSWEGCLNRTYYACFYAVNALLLAHDMSSTKHSGVRSLFNKNFVNGGVVSKELGALYNHLYTNRMNSDYEDLSVVDQADVLGSFQDARGFIEEIKRLTQQQLDSQSTGEK